MNLSFNLNFLPCFILFFILTAFFSACTIDDTTPNAVDPHNYVSFEALFKDRIYEVETKIVDAAELIELNSTFDTNLKLAENSLLQTNGDMATGAVEVQFIELLKKSDLVMSGLSLERSNGTLLELAGGFSVTAWQNQEQLDFDGTLELDFDESRALSDENGVLEVYYSGTTDNSPLEVATDQSSVELVGDRYELVGSKIGWVLAAQDFIPSNGTTSLSLNSNLNESEIMDERAFVVFNDFTGGVSLPKNGNTFSTVGLPIGQSATIVMTAFDKRLFYIATKEITISENQSLDMVLQGYPVADFVTLLKAID